MQSLSADQAYKAMYAFLEGVHSRDPETPVRDLLSWLALLPDGHPADPAMADDWAAACTEAASGRVNTAFELRP